METMIKKHKSHRYCSVPHCKSTCSREISLFLFPKSKDLAKQWSDILDIRRQATKYIYVCSLHFDKKDFTLSMSAKKRRLKNGAVPSKNLPVKSTSSGPRATQLRVIEDNKLRGRNKRERVPFKKMLKDGASNSDSLAECRACLQLCSNEEQHNLFKCWDPPWVGMENTPAEDLSKLACVQISQTDTHSKILCQSCYTHLQNACQFVEIVKKADEVLSLRIGVNNPHTPDSWPKPIQVDKNVPYDKVQIKDEIFSDEETQQINEEDFSNVDVKIEADDWPSQSVHINGIISLGQLNKEMAEINGYLPDVEQNGKINGLTSEGPITNGVVNYKHDKADSFNTNCLIVSVKDEPVSDDESETNASELSLDCILCCKRFSSLTGLKAHVIAQHSYKVLRRKTIDDAQESLLNNVCKICKRRFETSTDLMVHETCHNMCVCYGCNTSFETFDQLSQHRQSCKSLKNSEVGKVLKLEDVQRMANTAQRILEVITKFTIFSQNSEHGNIDECYQALLAVITQKEESICDDLSCDYDALCNMSDLESCDDTLLEYNKHFLSDFHLQKKSSKLIESSVVERNITSQTDDDFNSMEHSVTAIGKLLSYPVVKITRLESPILQNNKRSYLYDNHSDTASSNEDFEELDEFLDSEELLISSHKRADGVEKQMAKENENPLILSNSEFSTEIDTSKDIILHPDFNDIHEKSLSSGFLLFNASNSITEEENIDSLDFDDDDDEFHTDNVSVCLDILSKYFPDETENDENFAKSSTQTLSKVAFKSSFAFNVANTHLNPVADDEIINLIDEPNDNNFKKPCIVEPISVNINTPISQIPQNNTTDIASRALTLFNISESRVIENATIINANLDTTPLGLSGDKTINYICQKPLTTCALKSNIVNEHCSDVLIKQIATREINLTNFYKLHANETHGIEKHRIKNKSHAVATDVKISENNSKLQTVKLSTSIVGCENDVIGSDICKDKKASSRELLSSVTCNTNSQIFQPLPRLVGVNNKFIFRYRSTRKIRRGCKLDCKFGCMKIFTSHLRYNKFKDFWKMNLSAQTKFLDDKVVKKISRKLPRNRFFLPNSNKSVRVCRKFIEDTFSILMLSYRKEFKKCKLSYDDYFSNVGNKDTKVLDCCKKQTLSECVSSIDIFKENITNSNGDTKQCDVIKKSNNIVQSNYGAEKCCISSIPRNIKSNVSSGDTPIVHCSMKNGNKRLVDKTGSEINKNIKICSKKSNVESSTRNNEYVSGASNIKKRYRYNNITINVSTSDKVSISRLNPYVKIIDIGFYPQLHSLDSPGTSSTNSTQTHSQLLKNIDFSNIFQNVDPSHSCQSDKNNVSYRIDTDLDIPNNDCNSKGILENEVKTIFSHSPFEDLTAKDIHCQSILHDKLKSEIANENQQISNVHTNCRTLLHDEIKTKTLPLEFQASDEESNSQSILQNEIESNLYLSNNINSEMTNNYSSSYNIDGHDHCSSVKDLPKSYVKSNKHNTIEDNLPLLNLKNILKITKYQVSKCHTRDNIDDNFPHLPAEDLVPSYKGSNLQDEMEINPLLVNLNPQCTDEDSKCNDMTNHINQLSGKDFSNEESMTGEIAHNDDSSYHCDSARDIIDHHFPPLPIEHLAPSNEGSNLQHEIVNKLLLSLNSNPQSTNEDSRCSDIQNRIMRLTDGDLSNEETKNEQSTTGEMEHNDDSSYHSDSARDIIDHHLPDLPTIDLVPCNEVINIQNEMKTKLPLLLNPNPQCTNEDSRCNDIQNRIMLLSDGDLSNEESKNEQSMTGEIEHNDDSTYHSDSARDIIDDHLPPLPIEHLAPSNEGSKLQREIVNKLLLSLNPNPQSTNEDSRCNDIQNNLMRLSDGDLSNEETKNQQSMTGEIEHNEGSSYHSHSARDLIDDHLPLLPAMDLVPCNEVINLQNEMENKLPLLLNPNPQCTNEESRCNDTQNNIIRLSGGDLSNEESENKQSMTGEIEHNDDSSYHSGSARDIIDHHLHHLSIKHLAPSNEGRNLQREIVNKLPLLLNPDPQSTNKDSRCDDTQNHIMRLSGGDLSNEKSENKQSIAGEIEHNEDNSYHSDSARDIIDEHLPLLPSIDLVPCNEVLNLQNEMENKLPLLLNPNRQCTNEDSRCNDMVRHIMLLPDKHVSNEENKNEQGMAGEIEHNEGSRCHSIRQDLIKNHLPHMSNENLLKSSDESGLTNLQNDIINKLPLSSNIQITNADAFCEVLCDSRIKQEDSNGQNIIYPLNDDPQNYNRDSPRPTIGEETLIKTLPHTFHTDTHEVCYENDPKIAQDFNSSTIFDYPYTNLQIDNKDIFQQQNVKSNLSHLTITNSLTYNNIGNGESYCHSSSNFLESQISINESNSSQMSFKCSVPEKSPEIYFEGLFQPQSQLLIDGKTNLKQHYRKKSNHFKLQRIIGKGYKFIFRYKVTRSLRPGCQHCTYKCTQAIGFDQRRVLFENFWKMDIHAQTSYLNENVFLINPILGLHDINETRMKRNHKFFFTVYGKRFRVCKTFFLNTLSIHMTDLKNDSRRLKVIRERLNPHVKLIDIGFHKEPQPAIEVVSCVSNDTSSMETFVLGSWNASLDSYSKLNMHSPHTKIKLPENVRLEAVNVDDFQSDSCDSQSQSPVYAQLSTVDQYYDKEIIRNICSLNAEPCDKNTHLMKPHEINSIGPFITNVTQASKEEQSFKAILNNWSKSQDPIDKQKRAPFKCTTNYNQMSTKNCTHTTYIETKSDSFYKIDEKLKNMDIFYEFHSDSANTSSLDLRQTISVPNFLDCDDHINKVAFGSKSYESDTEVFLKDSQIQNASALSSLSSAETNPGVESQTELQEDKVTDALQLSTRNGCVVSELSKIDSVLIATAQHDINSALNQSEWQLGHRKRGNITTTAVTDLLPTFTNSINNETTKLTNSVYGLDKITIDQNTSVINIDEEKSRDTIEKHTNVIQDNTDLNEQLNQSQASVTSDIAMESFKCSTLNIEISNQTNKIPSNTDSLATETDGVVTPIQDKNNLNNGVTLLSHLDVQYPNYYNTKDNPCSSPKETSFTYTDSCSSSSDYLESKEMQLMNDNRLESDYVQLSNVYEPPCIDNYLITKNTYGTESSCSHFAYDTRNFSQSSLEFYPSFGIQNVVESDVPQSFESILNDWAS